MDLRPFLPLWHPAGSPPASARKASRHQRPAGRPSNGIVGPSGFLQPRGRIYFFGAGCRSCCWEWRWRCWYFYGRVNWFGFAGGVLSLALFCFDPNFIAHSGLVTTDVGEVLFLFGAVYFLWRTCRRLEAASVVLFLLFFSLAFVTKFSAVLLLPIFWLTVLGRMLSPEPLPIGTVGRVKLVSPASQMALFAGLFGAALLTTYATIWASYSFRYSAAQSPEAAAKIEAQILRTANPASGPPNGVIKSLGSLSRTGIFPDRGRRTDFGRHKKTAGGLAARSGQQRRHPQNHG